MPTLIFFDGKPTPVSRAIQAMRDEGVPESYIGKFLDTAEFAAGSFDESKIKRASDGKFAPKGSAGGSKSADAAVGDAIVSRPPPLPKKPGDVRAELDRMLDDTPGPRKQPAQVEKSFVQKLARLSTGAVRRTSSFLQFFTPAGFVNIPSLLGQDPGWKRMEREYGRPTASMIVASGHVFQNLGWMAGAAAAAVGAAAVGTAVGAAAGGMAGAVGLGLNATKMAQDGVKALAIGAFLGTGAATLMTPKDSTHGVGHAIKNFAIMMNDLSRWPGEEAAKIAFRSFGIKTQSQLDAEKSRKPVAFASELTGMTLPEGDIKRLGQKYHEYLTTQVLTKLFQNADFVEQLKDWLLKNGVTEEMLHHAAKKQFGSKLST